MAVRTEMSTAVDYRTWPVSWTAIWVGMLSAVAVGLVVGLVGIALGAQQSADLAPGKMSLMGMVFAVLGSFFSFVVGGWAAARISGIWHDPTAALHGAIVWLLAVPVLILLASLGAGSLYGAWLHGLAGTPAWATPAVADPIAVRNSALGAATALLLGLVGSTIGAWLGSNMNESDYRKEAGL